VRTERRDIDKSGEMISNFQKDLSLTSHSAAV
jgi:hypothetical protein